MTLVEEFFSALSAPSETETREEAQVPQKSSLVEEFFSALSAQTEPSAIEFQRSPGGITPEILERAGVRTFDQAIPGQNPAVPAPPNIQADIMPHPLQPDVKQPVGLDGEGFDSIGGTDVTGNGGRRTASIPVELPSGPSLNPGPLSISPQAQGTPKTFEQVSQEGTPFIAPDGSGNLDRISRDVAGDVAETTSKFTESFAKAIDSLPGVFLPFKALTGIDEVLSNFTTGFLGSIAGGLAGLVELAVTGDVEGAIDTIDRVAGAMTYEVKTQMGKDIRSFVDVPFEKYNEFVDKLVDSGDLVGGFTPEEQPLANAIMSAVLKGPVLLLLSGGAPKAFKTVRSASKTKPAGTTPFRGEGAELDPILLPEKAKELEIRQRIPDEPVIEKPSGKLPKELAQVDVIAEKPIEKPVVVPRETLKEEVRPVKPELETTETIKPLKAEAVKVEPSAVDPELGKITSKPKPENQVDGKKSKLLLNRPLKTGETELPIVYRLKERADIISSNKTDFSLNEEFPKKAQDRQREFDKNQKLRVEEMVNNPQLERIFTDNPAAENGPPITVGGRVVAGGNGRTLVLNKLAERPEGSKLIRDSIESVAEKFGFTKEQVAKFKDPIITRDIDIAPKDMSAFRDLVAVLNKDSSAALTTAEQSASRGRRVSPETVEKIGASIAEGKKKSVKDKTTGESRVEVADKTIIEALDDNPTGILDALIKDGVFSRDEVGQLFDPATRKLTKGAKTEIVDLFVGRILEGAELLSNTPPSTRLKLAGATPSILKTSTKGAKEQGFDLTEDLKVAVENANTAYKQGHRNSTDALGQESLFSETKLTPMSQKALGLFKSLMDENPTTFSKRLKDYGKKATDASVGQKGLFGAVLPRDAFNDAFKGVLTEKDLLTDHRAEMADTAKLDGIDEALMRDADIRHDIEKGGKGNSNLYSGVPSELISTYFNKAVSALRKKLSPEKPVKGVNVKTEPPETGLGLLQSFRSPRMLAKEHPELMPYVEDGIAGADTYTIVSEQVIRRLNTVDRALRGNAVGSLGRLSNRLSPKSMKRYRENQHTLNNIMVEGDLTGKEFTLTELQERGAGPEVIKAYRINRNLYKKALELGNKSRIATGKEPIIPLGGYVSHVFHDFFIVADKKVVGSAKTLNEAIKIGNEIKAGGAKKVDILPKEFEFPEEVTQAAHIGDIEYFKMKEQLEKDFNLTLDEASEILEGIARRTGRKKFFGHFMERKGVPGWEKNLNLINQHYFLGISRFIATNQFKNKAITRYERQHGKFENEPPSTMARYKKEYINDFLGVPTELEVFFNEVIQSSVNTPFGKLTGMDSFVKAFLGKRPSRQLAQIEATTMAVTKLGLLNVSSAFTNLTQVLNTQAVLGPKYTMIGVNKFVSDHQDSTEILRRIGVREQPGLTTREITTAASALGKAVRGSLILFTKAEYFNRATAGLGAYYKAIDGNVKGIKKGDRVAARRYAEEVIDRTQFRYGVEDAPNIFRRTQGSPLASLVRFKKFPIKELEFITSLEGAENPRFWIPFMVTVGYGQFPGAQALDKMVNEIFGFSPIDETDRALIEWAGDDSAKIALRRTIMKGWPASVAKVDISGRAGQGDIVPDSVSDLKGPAISTVSNSISAAKEREWLKMTKSIAPSIGNFIEAYLADGALTSAYDRNRKVIDITPYERFVKAMGLMNIEESEAQTFARITRNDKERERKARIRAIDDFIASIGSRDKSLIHDNIATLKELGVSPKSVRDEMKKKKMSKLDRIFMFSLSKRDKLKNLALYLGLKEDDNRGKGDGKETIEKLRVYYGSKPDVEKNDKRINIR